MVCYILTGICMFTMALFKHDNLIVNHYKFNKDHGIIILILLVPIILEIHMKEFVGVKIITLFNQVLVAIVTFLSLQSTYWIKLDSLLLHSMVDFLLQILLVLVMLFNALYLLLSNPLVKWGFVFLCFLFHSLIL